MRIRSLGLQMRPQMTEWNDIKSWRKERRAELIARRAALDAGVRHAATACVTRLMTQAFVLRAGTVVAFCWPHKGELDARFAVRLWREQGAIAALPEVAARGSPLRFRKWWPGAPMKAGVMGIPVPDATAVVVPDVAVVPMVGWDSHGYRLGYGGGYFDATLAALTPRPVAIGLSQEIFRLETIFPAAHDIPMDFVVTEAAIYEAGGEALRVIAAPDARERMAKLSAKRGLLRGVAPEDACGYRSPPCYAHEFPGYMGGPENGKP
jgi:5,10-methenyltetrahydrofolate synthetase